MSFTQCHRINADHLVKITEVTDTKSHVRSNLFHETISLVLKIFLTELQNIIGRFHLTNLTIVPCSQATQKQPVSRPSFSSAQCIGQLNLAILLCIRKRIRYISTVYWILVVVTATITKNGKFCITLGPVPIETNIVNRKLSWFLQFNFIGGNGKVRHKKCHLRKMTLTGSICYRNRHADNNILTWPCMQTSQAFWNEHYKYRYDVGRTTEREITINCKKRVIKWCK